MFNRSFSIKSLDCQRLIRGPLSSVFLLFFARLLVQRFFQLFVIHCFIRHFFLIMVVSGVFSPAVNEGLDLGARLS